MNVVLVHGGFVDGSGWEAVYAALRSKPSWYLVARDDRMIPPPAQRFMAKRARATVIEVAGSHAVYISQPAAVVELIAEASGRLSSRPD